LPDNARLSAEQSKQQRHKAKESPRSHNPPVVMGIGFAASR
jgi:hypothetical protein